MLFSSVVNLNAMRKTKGKSVSIFNEYYQPCVSTSKVFFFCSFSQMVFACFARKRQHVEKRLGTLDCKVPYLKESNNLTMVSPPNAVKIQGSIHQNNFFSENFSVKHICSFDQSCPCLLVPENRKNFKEASKHSKLQEQLMICLPTLKLSHFHARTVSNFVNFSAREKKNKWLTIDTDHFFLFFSHDLRQSKTKKTRADGLTKTWIFHCQKLSA